MARSILKYSFHQATSVTIDASTVKANEDGKKILKAGTPIGGKGTKVIAEGQTLAESKVGKIAEAEGILLNDVDVTKGNDLGAMVFAGSIDISALPVELEEGYKEAMPHIVFFKK